MSSALEAMMNALSGQESGGDYNARNADSGASGRWQIMPENWPSWAQEAGLPADAPMTPANQDSVVRNKLTQYYNKFGNWADVAAAWYSGQPLNEATADAPQGGGKYPSIRDYANSVIGMAFGSGAGSAGGGLAGGGLSGGDMTQPSADQPTPGGGTQNWDGAASQLQDALTELIANKPSRADYTDAHGFDSASYQAALGNWATSYQKLASAAKSLKEQSLGLTTLPDGTVIAVGDLSPEQRSQVETANANIYGDILNKFGLSQFNLLSGANKDRNATASADFQNKLAGYDAGLNFDTHSLASATAGLNRWLNAQTVAEKDASNIAAAQQQVGKWGTSNGKADFSGGDLGAGVSTLMRQGGMDPSQSILRFPGVQTLDPVGDRLRSLAAMGVSNAPPLIPAMRSTYGAIPGAPPLTMPPPPPVLQAPVLPPASNPAIQAPAGLPPWVPGNGIP